MRIDMTDQVANKWQTAKQPTPDHKILENQEEKNV